MDSRSNMRQAMFEMFGVGEDQTAAKEARVNSAVQVDVLPSDERKTSRLAAGTVFEGNLYSPGDVEVEGRFKGDIKADGLVKICSDFDGSISAESAELLGRSINGDVTVTGRLVIEKDSKLTGNVFAREVICAGEVVGDLEVSEGVELSKTARIEGGIVADSISVARGAAVRGGIEIKASNAPKVIVASAKPIEK